MQTRGANAVSQLGHLMLLLPGPPGIGPWGLYVELAKERTAWDHLRWPTEARQSLYGSGGEEGLLPITRH